VHDDILTLGLSILLVIPNRLAVLTIRIADVDVMAVSIGVRQRVVFDIAVEVKGLRITEVGIGNCVRVI
jgi:hypothetical protein